MVFSKYVSLFLLSALVGSAAATPTVVHSSVHRALRQQGTVNVIVTFKGGVDAPINAVIGQGEFPSRGEKIEALVANLESHAKASHKAVEAVLAGGQHGKFTSRQSFWISNQMVIKNADATLVTKIATVSNVFEIREEQVLPLPKVEFASAAPSGGRSLMALAQPSKRGNRTRALGGRQLAVNEYGVTKIGAPTVWAAGNTGTGVVVGSIDTGVLATHEALKANWRSSYGWYDPTALKAAPYDDNGHGTHTMGTIAGAGGIGVAPGATWITCRACTPTGCSQSNLLSCAQWITCPTDPAGNNKDCTKAPRVVSNSWGGGQGNTFFASAVNSWQTAGIIPVFANGNAGPACKTANSPGDYANVLAVGATDSMDGLASFSSKGPSVTGLIKPDLSAPGYNVRSAWNTGTAAYNTISGTSMATPHVSGVIALLVSKKPSLTYAQVKTALTSTTDRSTLKASGYTCGNTKDTTYPNNQYGWGRVNAATAFTKA